MKHVAILLHGYTGNPTHMTIIQKVMESWNLFDQVIKIGYGYKKPVVRFRGEQAMIEDTLVEEVRDNILNQVSPGKNIVHILGYSLGGLVARSLNKAIIQPQGENWLFHEESPQLASIVQLASPNNGTDPARFISDPSEVGLEQINQMKPNSQFIQWLNDIPNYFTSIPHNLMIGNFNSFNVKDFDDLVFHNECKREGIGNISLDTYKYEINHYNIVDWSQRTYEGAFIEQKMFALYSRLVNNAIYDTQSKLISKVF